MTYAELPTASQKALEQGRQTLLELAFACAKKLISPHEYQIENRTYNLAQLLFPTPHYANLEIPQNWTGIRIKITREPGSQIPPYWPSKTNSEVFECVFSLSKETSSSQSKYECKCCYIDGDKKVDQELDSQTITPLINALLQILTPQLASSPPGR
mgnify:CR=1 FL=1